MQDQVTAPDGTAVPSQALDLEARVSVLEEGLTRVVALLDKTAQSQAKLLQVFGDSRLLGAVKRFPEVDG